jgi:hypothetical protein
MHPASAHIAALCRVIFAEIKIQQGGLNSPAF